MATLQLGNDSTTSSPLFNNPSLQGLDLAENTQYVAGFGDTYKSIAEANGVSEQALRDANPSFSHEVYPGQILSIPPGGTGNPFGDVELFPGARDLLQPPQQNQASGDQNLGKLSEKYETGGRGPGTVSSGAGDSGGVSYGSYQLATNRNRPQEFLANEGKQWASEFKGLQPGTAKFSAKWKEIAAREPEAFQAAQHNFIQRTHYDVTAANIKNNGLDISQRSAALRDVVWSTSVQHGPNNKIVQKAMDNLTARGIKQDNPNYDRELIQAIYAERGRRNSSGELVHFSANSRSVQEGVAQRFKDEQADALNMLNAETNKPKPALAP